MVSIRRVSACFTTLALLVSTVSADTLSTSGFTECGTGPQDIAVNQFQISMDRTTKEIVFAVAGTSKISQNITGIPSFCMADDSSNKCHSIRKSSVYQHIQPLHV
jgi:Tol biopolymer transport system component